MLFLKARNSEDRKAHRNRNIRPNVFHDIGAVAHHLSWTQWVLSRKTYYKILHKVSIECFYLSFIFKSTETIQRRKIGRMKWANACQFVLGHLSGQWAISKAANAATFEIAHQATPSWLIINFISSKELSFVLANLWNEKG